jgi:hypothetical protein
LTRAESTPIMCVNQKSLRGLLFACCAVLPPPQEPSRLHRNPTARVTPLRGRSTHIPATFGGTMPSRFMCSECGTAFRDPIRCPFCDSETLPDTLHHGDSRTATMLVNDELTGPQRMVADMMRENAGVRAV